MDEFYNTMLPPPSPTGRVLGAVLVLHNLRVYSAGTQFNRSPTRLWCRPWASWQPPSGSSGECGKFNLHFSARRPKWPLVTIPPLIQENVSFRESQQHLLVVTCCDRINDEWLMQIFRGMFELPGFFGGGKSSSVFTVLHLDFFDDETRHNKVKIWCQIKDI